MCKDPQLNPINGNGQLLKALLILIHVKYINAYFFFFFTKHRHAYMSYTNTYIKTLWHECHIKPTHKKNINSQYMIYISRTLKLYFVRNIIGKKYLSLTFNSLECINILETMYLFTRTLTWTSLEIMSHSFIFHLLQELLYTVNLQAPQCFFFLIATMNARLHVFTFFYNKEVVLTCQKIY